MPNAKPGWLEGPVSISGRPGGRAPGVEVTIGDVAEAQLALLDAHGVDTRRRALEALVLGPMPHAYRRIKKQGDLYTLAVKRARVEFVVTGQVIHVTRVRLAAVLEELGEEASRALMAALDALVPGEMRGG